MHGVQERELRPVHALPGTTICGLADGTNWALRTIVNKYRDEFEARVRPVLVPLRVGAT